jgi:hypothetical protein
LFKNTAQLSTNRKAGKQDEKARCITHMHAFVDLLNGKYSTRGIKFLYFLLLQRISNTPQAAYQERLPQILFHEFYQLILLIIVFFLHGENPGPIPPHRIATNEKKES